MKTKVLALHGFLGSPSHFDFLRHDFDIYAPNLDNYVHLNYEELLAQLQNAYPIDECSILGYSFGARLGLRIYDSLNIKENKILCLAGHMGLQTELDRIQRRPFEDQIVSKLERLSSREFIEYWNNISLFEHDRKTILHSLDNTIAALYLKNYGLSKQPFLKDVLLSFKNNILFLYGDLDIKYKTYAQQELSDYKTNFIPSVGHRLLQHPEIILPLIRDFYES